jgi:hypothetical protein
MQLAVSSYTNNYAILLWRDSIRERPKLLRVAHQEQFDASVFTNDGSSVNKLKPHVPAKYDAAPLPSTASSAEQYKRSIK